MWYILWITVLSIGVGAEHHLDLQSLFKDLILTDVLNAIDPEGYSSVSEVPSEEVTESPSPSPHDEETTRESSKASMTYAEDLPKTANGYSTAEQYSDDGSRNAYNSQMDLTPGVPGIDYPYYTGIPQTTFTCPETAYHPGFYADVDTDCQVFHVCWPHRMESFLCPIGTTFSQPLLACDYWYRSNCSLAPYYYDSDAGSRFDEYNEDSNTLSMVDFLLESLATTETKEGNLKVHEDVRRILKFLPVKAKVSVYPEDSKSRSKIVAEASVGKNVKGSKFRQIRKQAEMKPDFTPMHTKRFEAPLETQTTSGPKVKRSTYVTRSVGLAVDIFSRVLDLVRGILKDIENLRTGKVSAAEGRMNDEERLLKLKQKFVSKPVAMLKNTNQKPVLPTETEVKKGTDAPTREAELDGKKFSKRQFVLFPSQPVQTLSISSSTREALIENYIRLYRMRKA